MNDETEDVYCPCPDCGLVRLRARDVVVHLCTTNLSLHVSAQCPRCHLAMTARVDPSWFDELVYSGATVRLWALPTREDEPRSGPPIGHDDLLSFHEGLSDPHFADELESLAWNQPRRAKRARRLRRQR